jgi:cell division transport system permease protein
MKFILKETFRSIKKAKGSFLISLTTTTISIFLITFSYFLFDISEAIQDKLKSNVVLNAFLSDSLNSRDIELIGGTLQGLEFISNSVYISKEQAAEDFQRETGEDFSKILDYNPLPASFRVTLNKDYFSPEQLSQAVAELSAVRGVDEVVYGNDIAEKIFLLIENMKKYVLAAAVVLILISVYIIYSTSKLILKNRTDEIETIKLIGARISAIKLPVILNSIITGVIGGIVSLIIFNLFIRRFEDYISQSFSYNFEYFFLLGVTILAGPCLGGVISFLTLRRITLKI